MAMLLLRGVAGVNSVRSSKHHCSSSPPFNRHYCNRASDHISMVQEENKNQDQSQCLNQSQSPNRNRSNKKSKQKKIPQRGLGVAQLEKIRLEEQQKKEVSACYISNSSLCKPTHHHSSLRLSPSVTDSMFSFSNLHLFPPSFAPNPNIPTQVSAIDSCSATATHGFLPILWPNFNQSNEESNQSHEADTSKLDHFGLCNDSRLFYSSLLRRPTSLMSNKSILSSSSSSSGVNLQMEPPSNQSYNSNAIPLPWIEEERISGIKRPRPFFDNSFHGRSSCLPDSFYKSEELTAQESFKLEPNPIFKGSCSSSTAIQINWKLSSESDLKRTKDNLDGDFLTLASSSHSFPKCKQQTAISSQELSKFEFIQPQEVEGETSNGGVLLQSELKQQPFYRFLESAPSGDAMGSDEHRASENPEKPFIDLNLKL